MAIQQFTCSIIDNIEIVRSNYSLKCYAGKAGATEKTYKGAVGKVYVKELAFIPPYLTYP
jgi:hypothetical protein